MVYSLLSTSMLMNSGNILRLGAPRTRSVLPTLRTAAQSTATVHSPLQRTQREIREIFRTIGQPSHPFDLVEHQDKYELLADAPGMTPEEIKVELHEDTIKITGEHTESKSVEEGNGEEEQVYRTERRHINFSRHFVLPRTADTDQIKAVLDKGVLTVSIAKKAGAEESKTRNITVETAE